jgi:hypothetical protein
MKYIYLDIRQPSDYSTDMAKLYTQLQKKFILFNPLIGTSLHARPAPTAWFSYIINGFCQKYG